MKRLLQFLLLFGMLNLTACYRPAQMNMRSLYRPYLEKAKPGVSVRTTTFHTPQVTTLPLKQVVFHVLHSNARLRWLRQSQKVYWAKVGSFPLVSNPEIRVMGLSGALATGDVSNVGVRLRWSPPFPTVHAAEKDRARAEAMMKEQRLWQETYLLLATARKSHAQLLALDLRIRHAKQSLLRKKKAWQWEKKRRALDRTTALQVSSKRLVYVQAQTSLQRLQSSRMLQKSQLMQMLGVQGACQIVGHSGFLKSHGNKLTMRSLLKKALVRSPSLAILRNMYRAHHAALWIEKTKRIPWFSFFQLSYEFGESSWPYGFFLGMGMNLPVFTWNTGRIRLEKTQIRAIRAQTQVQVARTVLMVRAAYRRWQQLQQSVMKHRNATQKHIQQTQALVKKMRLQPAVTPEQIWRIEEQISKLQTLHIEQALQLHYARIALEQTSSFPVWQSFGIQPPKTK